MGECGNPNFFGEGLVFFKSHQIIIIIIIKKVVHYWD
jgi:hypothetical protein